MTSTIPPPVAASTPAIASVERLWLIVAAVFAVLTAWLHACQLAGVTFRIYALMAPMLAVAAAATAAIWSRPRGSPNVEGELPVRWLVGMGIAAAALALFSYRPDLDDVNYVPNVVHYLAHPDAPLDFRVHYIVGEHGRLATSVFQSTSLSYEFCTAAVSSLLGLPLLSTRYFVFPVFAGFLAPFAWFYALQRLGHSGRGAAFGALVILCLLPALGDTFRSYGNYAFVRLHMAKAVFLTIALPVWVGAALGFLREGCKRSWWLLACTAATSVGLTGSAIPVLTILAALLGASHWIVATPQRPDLRRTFAYGGSLVYLFGYTAAVLAGARRHLGADSALNAGWPTTFGGHFRFMFDAPWPASVVALVAATALALAWSRGYERRFLAAWCALAIALVLNPIVGPWLIEHVTSSNIYWRMFYVFPFPLAAGIAAACAFERRALAGRTTRRAVPIAIAAALLLQVLPCSTYRDIGELGVVPRYRLQLDKFEAATKVGAAAPPGPMLAPLAVAAYLPMTVADRPQMVTRESEMLLWLTSLGESLDVARTRLSAGDYLAGRGGSIDAVLAVLDRYPLRTVVGDRAVMSDAALRAALEQRRFGPIQDVESFAIWAREE